MSKNKTKKTQLQDDNFERSRRKIMYALPALGGAAILASTKSKASGTDISAHTVTSSLGTQFSTVPRPLHERFTDRVYAKDFGATYWHQDMSASSNIEGLNAAFEFANQESHNGERKVVDCGPSRISVNKSSSAPGVVDFQTLKWPNNTTVNYIGPSGENVLFLNHFSGPYGEYTEGVPVNELNITAPYHPALILNVKTKKSFGGIAQKAHTVGEANNSVTTESSTIGFRIDDDNVWQWIVNGDRLFRKNLWSESKGLLINRFVMSGDTGDVGIQRGNPQFPMDIAGGMRVVSTDQHGPEFNQYDNVNRFESPEVVLEKNIKGVSTGVKLSTDPKGEMLKVSTLHSASEGDAYLSLNKGFFYIVNSYSPNWQGAALKLGHNSQTQRSINVSGTINTQGRDYAEYMFKNESCGEILKGDVCGIDNKGLLTDKWNEAISFVIKSTNPSFVGGDDWHEKVLEPISEQATEQERESYLKRLQEERKKVDRIAFSGQVPVNIIDAEVGAYLVPVERNGKIGVIAKSKSDLSMTEYMDSVGKVIAIGDDGRTIALVKVC